MFSKDFKYRLEALLLKAVLAVLRLPGLDAASAAGGWLGRTFGPKLGITRRARRRIERVMPKLRPEEVDRILAAMWDNLGRMAFEYAYLDKFTLPSERHRIEVVGAEKLRERARAGHGGMLLSAHFANFELMPLAMSLEGFEGGAIYRPANNPYVNRWMTDMRVANTHAVQIPKGRKGTRELLRLIHDNKFVAMLYDQKMNEGIKVTLFGLPAMTTPSPAGLAVRSGTPLIPVYMERTKGANFRITVYDPIEVRKEAEPAGEIVRITQVLNDFLEARIREKPENWFWLHNRWAE